MLTRNRKHGRRRGMLTFEWIVLVTVLVVGIIPALGAVRNAFIRQMQDMKEQIEALNIQPEQIPSTDDNDLTNEAVG